MALYSSSRAERAVYSSSFDARHISEAKIEQLGYIVYIVVDLISLLNPAVDLY